VAAETRALSAVAAVKLSVNIDHVATLRQARRTPYPDPVDAARLAEAAGASGITAHLRVDRRHIQPSDIERLRQWVRGKFNLELSMADEMVALAETLRPDQVTLVPERAEEVTTEGGLDLLAHGSRVHGVARRLSAAGIAVSVFVDPRADQLAALAALAAGSSPRPVAGFELNTDAYTRAPSGEAQRRELALLSETARLGLAHGFRLYAGHGLTTGNVAPVAALHGMEELNIGHAIVSRAVLVGMEEAVREMLQAMRGEAGH
jgi:pyridoxine 5-phosphate synthase